MANPHNGDYPNCLPAAATVGFIDNIEVSWLLGAYNRLNLAAQRTAVTVIKLKAITEHCSFQTAKRYGASKILIRGTAHNTTYFDGAKIPCKTHITANTNENMPDELSLHINLRGLDLGPDKDEDGVQVVGVSAMAMVDGKIKFLKERSYGDFDWPFERA